MSGTAVYDIVTKLAVPNTVSKTWQIGSFIGLIILSAGYFFMAFWYSQQYGQYTSTPYSIQKLLTIKRSNLSNAIDTLNPNTNSVCAKLLAKTGVYSKITVDQTALVNWRPMTVRLPGYLGGIHSALDGVFDMTAGVNWAINQGARAFVFDIDYLDTKPCDPVIVFRDDKGYMRSLMTGNIREGMQALTSKAFVTNYDPVMVIVYIRRIPPSSSQQKSFFQGIAASLSPLSAYHLGVNEKGNFHNCRQESTIFTSPITDFQKNFIVLCNYDTTKLPQTSNPKDNLDFWVHARMYLDPSGISGSLGSVTTTVPQGQIAYAKVGALTQLLNIGTVDQGNYATLTRNTFTIALGNPNTTLSNTQINKLLNTLGVQCVPLDVVSFAAAKVHEATINTVTSEALAATQAGRPAPPTMTDLSNSMNDSDPLSFWAYGGWGHKYIST